MSQDDGITFHPDGSIPQHGEVFVFGANLAGRHGGGAAAEAERRFGAQMGVGWGYMGTPPRHSFAIPTLDEHFEVLPLEEIARYVERFIQFVAEHPQLRFFITRVGCGIAGYRDEQIAPLFRPLVAIGRCSFAEKWRPYLFAET